MRLPPKWILTNCDPVRCCCTVVAALFFLWCWSVIMEHSQSPWLALQNGPLHIVPALIHFTVAGFHFPRDYRQQTGKAVHVCGWEIERSLRGEEATCFSMSSRPLFMPFCVAACERFLGCLSGKWFLKSHSVVFCCLALNDVPFMPRTSVPGFMQVGALLAACLAHHHAFVPCVFISCLSSSNWDVDLEMLYFIVVNSWCENNLNESLSCTFSLSNKRKTRLPRSGLTNLTISLDVFRQFQYPTLW